MGKEIQKNNKELESGGWGESRYGDENGEDDKLGVDNDSDSGYAWWCGEGILSHRSFSVRLKLQFLSTMVQISTSTLKLQTFRMTKFSHIRKENQTTLGCTPVSTSYVSATGVVQPTKIRMAPLFPKTFLWVQRG